MVAIKGWPWKETEDPTRYHSSPLQIGKRSYNLQELTKIGKLKTGSYLKYHYNFYRRKLYSIIFLTSETITLLFSSRENSTKHMLSASLFEIEYI